ncbi:MAG: family 10 glycosylhydrolase [Mangrovibacterium sp.]
MRQLIRIITPRALLFLFLLLSFGLYSGCNDDDNPEPEPPAEITPASRALWVWASTFTSGGEDIQAIVDQLAESNVNEVYLNCGLRSFRTETLIGQLTDFITKAHAEEIKVHLWFMMNTSEAYIEANPGAVIYHCPYPQGGYTDPYPVNDSNYRVNLLWPGYKEDCLENIRYFLTNFDCDGIHLDGIRYSHFVYSFDEYSLQKAADLGVNTTRLLSFFNTAANYTTYATNAGFVDLYVDGDEDVVKWVEMRKNVIYEYIEAIRETMEEVKPGLELTAAFMPEGATNPAYSDVYYAQNFALHSTVLDMISPMAYFKSYGKSTSWITDVTYSCKKLADPACRIATGIQADVTASEMNEQIRNAFNMGSDGVVIFRYGIMTDPTSWNVLKVWFEKDWEGRVQ